MQGCRIGALHLLDPWLVSAADNVACEDKRCPLLHKASFQVFAITLSPPMYPASPHAEFQSCGRRPYLLSWSDFCWISRQSGSDVVYLELLFVACRCSPPATRWCAQSRREVHRTLRSIVNAKEKIRPEGSKVPKYGLCMVLKLRIAIVFVALYSVFGYLDP